MQYSLLATGLLLIAFGSQAAKPIQDHFAPPSQIQDTQCQISVSNNNVDYGPQSRWQMQDVAGKRQAVTPGIRQFSLTAVCPYTHDMRLKVIGEKNIRGGFSYGKSGELELRVLAAQLDGLTVPIALTSSTGTLLSAPQDHLLLMPGVSFAPVVGHQPVHGKAFNVRMEIKPVITDQDARVSHRQTNESHITFELAD